MIIYSGRNGETYQINDDAEIVEMPEQFLIDYDVAPEKEVKSADSNEVENAMYEIEKAYFQKKHGKAWFFVWNSWGDPDWSEYDK